MRMQAKGNCDFCNTPLINWDYRYNGKHYCRSCYDRDFSVQVCDVCNKCKMIEKSLHQPICKICQVKDRPCIRCAKAIINPGMITEHGPVCNSCSKYFREQKQCTECGEYKHHVSNRSVEKGQKLLCQNCYNKTLLTCVMCQRKSKTFRLDPNGKSICKKCVTESRNCAQCGNPFPAGRGKICSECSSINGIKKKMKFYQGALRDEVSQIAEGFSGWLVERRGVQFTSHRFMYYFPYFQDIEQLVQDLSRWPTYYELVEAFTVSKMRKYLLATRYLEESGLITVDKAVKDEFANWNMIDRYLSTFKEGSFFHQVLGEYFDVLNKKLIEGRTTVRSIRLAITPVVKLFQYCEYCNENQPTQLIFQSYLWLFPGQKSTITGFVNFLNVKTPVELSLREVVMPSLERPLSSRERLKMRLIVWMRREYVSTVDKENFLRVVIGFLHWIHIPDDVRIGFCEIKKNKGKEHFIQIAGKVFYLPDRVAKRLTKNGVDG